MSDHSAEQVSALIGAIYDCAIDPERWAGALKYFCEELDFYTGVVGLVRLTTGANLVAASFGLREDHVQRLGELQGAQARHWGGRAVVDTFPLEEPLVLSRVNPQAVRPDYWLRAELAYFLTDAYGDTVTIGLTRDPDSLGLLSFARHKDVGLIEDDEIALFRVLAPHIQRAAAINRLLEVQQLTSATLAAALDRLSAAVILVSARGAILHANTAAHELLAQGDPLMDVRGMLCARAPGVQAQLLAAIERSSRDDPRLADGVPAPGRNGEPITLHVFPLGQGTVRPGLLPGAVSAVFVTQVSVRVGRTTTLAARMFSLTPAEARAFDGLAAGRTVAEVARELGVRPSTIKTHSLRIFEKTGVHRQAELVALAHALTPPFRD
jgi:DNA-binding CsgD family transcriptional regulator